MDDPFLTIITRTYKRPKLLARCQASVRAQTDPDLEHVVLTDHVGMGIYVSYHRMINEAGRYHGSYIYCLDDDNVLTDTAFVADLKAIAAEHNPDVIMVKASNPTFGVLPKFWGETPKRCNVDLGNFVVKGHVWMEYAPHFLDIEQLEDYGFIAAVFEAGCSVYWHDALVMEALQVGWGKPEDV